GRAGGGYPGLCPDMRPESGRELGHDVAHGRVGVPAVERAGELTQVGADGGRVDAGDRVEDRRDDGARALDVLRAGERERAAGPGGGGGAGGGGGGGGAVGPGGWPPAGGGRPRSYGPQPVAAATGSATVDDPKLAG